MKKQLLSDMIPIKIIDNFLEAPQIWRTFALKQEYFVDEISNFPGEYSKTLNEINSELFHSIAKKLIQNLQGYSHFKELLINFRIADGSYGTGWIHSDDPRYNVAGLIYLNDIPQQNSGTILYNKILDTNESFEHFKDQEFASNPKDRSNFERYKQKQRLFFQKNTTIHNVFNRCVMYSPLLWHSADTFFGTTRQDSRLTLNFFGIAAE
jgi:hypothetical protein